MKNGILAISIWIVVIGYPSTGSTSPDVCPQLQKKIERFQRLRRQGGTAKQMESWKRSLRKAEEKYRANGCK